MPNYAIQRAGSGVSATVRSGLGAPRSIFVYADSVTGYLKIKEHGRGSARSRGWIKASPQQGAGADPVISAQLSRKCSGS